MSDVRHELTVCPECIGDGFTAEHDPNDPHINGCSNCPIQVQCDTCEGTGIVWKKDFDRVQEKIDEETINDLPF